MTEPQITFFGIVGPILLAIAGIVLKPYIPKLAQWAKAAGLNTERVDNMNNVIIEMSARLSALQTKFDEAQKEIDRLKADAAKKDEAHTAAQDAMNVKLAEMRTNLETVQRFYNVTYEANIRLEAEKKAIADKAELQAAALQDAALRITTLEQQHEEMQAQLKSHSAAQDFAKQIVSHVVNGFDAILAQSLQKQLVKEVTP